MEDSDMLANLGLSLTESLYETSKDFQLANLTWCTSLYPVYLTLAPTRFAHPRMGKILLKGSKTQLSGTEDK